MNEQDEIRIVQYGLGPIGQATAKEVLRRDGLALVGAIDADPQKIGKDVGELLGLGERTGVVVGGDADEVLRASGAGVVLHTTSSFLGSNHEQIELCVVAGMHVVSSCEELFFPHVKHPELTRRLDELARENDVVILGVGVNPGFVMDTLALAATGVCNRIERLRVERVVDAALRRLSLQRKVGAGLTTAEFAQRKAAGQFGHIGLRESLLFVADGLGWKLDRVEEELAPVVSAKQVTTPYLEVQPGQVAGIHQTVRGFCAGDEKLSLDLKMYVGADEPHDAVRVDGDPPVDLVIRGGVFGDTATVATLINAIPRAIEASRGLRTMKEIALPRAFAL